MRLLLIFAIILAISCNNDKSDTSQTEKDTAGATTNKPVDEPKYDRSLVGRWRPVQVDVPELSEEKKKELLEHATIEFTATGNISSTVKEETRTGTYMFSEQDSKLHTKLGSKEEKFDISWDNDLLKMKNDEGVVTLRRL